MNYLYLQPKANSTILQIAHTAAIPNNYSIFAQRTRLQFEHQQYRSITHGIISDILLYPYNSHIIHKMSNIVANIILRGTANPTKLLSLYQDTFTHTSSVEHYYAHKYIQTISFTKQNQQTHYSLQILSSITLLTGTNTPLRYTFHTRRSQLYILTYKYTTYYTTPHTHTHKHTYIQNYNIYTKPDLP